ncbi:MAG: hypothetical protein Q8R16_00345, partial [bacterium]|nr:hypothetical protein [bacterium]
MDYGATPINGVTPIDISGPPDVNGEYSYAWTIPVSTTLTVGNAGKIKAKVVSPSTQSAVAGVSAGFQVKASVTLVAPNSGVTDLVIGQAKTIEWTPFGNIVKFRIEYKYDTSAWAEITPVGGVVGTVSGANKTWSWTVLNPPSNNVLFKVSDYDNANVSSTSSGANTIKGQLSLVTPDAVPQTFYIGDAIPIQWTKTGTIGNLKIEYSAKGDWTDTLNVNPSYASGADGTNTLTPAWTAPSMVAETYKVRLSNVTPPVGTELTDTSTVAFGVRPKITGITSPGSGEIWNTGDTTKIITWSAISAAKPDLTLPKVKFQYLVAGGVWTDILTLAGLPVEVDCVNGTNNYTWVRGVADEKSEDVKIRVYFKDYASELLESASFKIRPVITLDASLNAALKLTAFSNNANLVKWTSTGTKITTVNVRYDLYNGNGANGIPNDADDYAGIIQDLVPIASGAAGVTWNPAPDVSNSPRIRVVDTGNANVKADSPTFKIIGGLTLTAPSGSATTWIAKSTTNNISWSFSGTIASVKIYYDSNSGKGADNIAGNADDYNTNLPIATVPQVGSSGTTNYLWNPMPDTVTNFGRIKITNAADEVNVFSIGTDFNIGAQFDLTQPEGGHIAYATESYDILWNAFAINGVTKVALYYTNDSGAPSPTWNLITNLAPNTGLYTWSPIPFGLADLNNTNKIRITQFNPLNETPTKNESAANFSILGKLIVTVPGTGSESWVVNTTQAIKFKKKGAIQSVDLYYSYDGTALNYVK